MEQGDTGTSTTEAVDVAVLQALMHDLGDDDGSLRDDLIDAYGAEAPVLSGQLAAAAASDDRTTVARAAHTFRSTSALLGAMALASLLQDAETAALTTTAALPPTAAAVELEHARVLVALAGLRGTRMVG